MNDAHGHAVGDAALVHVATLLAGLVRSTDLAARIGGDEFALILDHLDHNSAIEAAERIARVIAQSPLEVEGKAVLLEASIGTATILPGDSAEDAMKRADRNMYLAKGESAGSYRSFK
jgi:diguanylate cyclase (GGDEF)-like protein